MSCEKTVNDFYNYFLVQLPEEFRQLLGAQFLMSVSQI
jgi:hypothetical protein